MNHLGSALSRNGSTFEVPLRQAIRREDARAFRAKPTATMRGGGEYHTAQGRGWMDGESHGRVGSAQSPRGYQGEMRAKNVYMRRNSGTTSLSTSLERVNSAAMTGAAELRVRSASLQGFPPFPTWNGTIAAPSEDMRGLCSILSADGELVVLQNSRAGDEQEAPDSWLRVRKVVPPPLLPAGGRFTSFCQCWARGGAVVATAHDRIVTFYSSEDFRVLAKLQLRYFVTSMDVTRRRHPAASSDEEEFLLLVGTAFGSFLYHVPLDSQQAMENGGGHARHDAADRSPTPLAGVHEGAAVSLVKFSSDGQTVAIGTMDGRLFLRTLEAHDEDNLASFGTGVLSRVLLSPRVTSMSFSACSSKLVVATWKGNVYVFTRSPESGEWRVLPSCQALSGNPKVAKVGGPAGSSKAATAAQTLVSCWGPVFVVCSRAIASRLEVYDFASGCLLHSLQLTPAAPPASDALSQWVDQQLVTGVCSWQSPDGCAGSPQRPSRLLCHDTSANVVVVDWTFLDIVGSGGSE